MEVEKLGGGRSGVFDRRERKIPKQKRHPLDCEKIHERKKKKGATRIIRKG